MAGTICDRHNGLPVRRRQEISEAISIFFADATVAERLCRPMVCWAPDRDYRGVFQLRDLGGRPARRRAILQRPLCRPKATTMILHPAAFWHSCAGQPIAGVAAGVAVSFDIASITFLAATYPSLSRHTLPARL